MVYASKSILILRVNLVLLFIIQKSKHHIFITHIAVVQYASIEDDDDALHDDVFQSKLWFGVRLNRLEKNIFL